MLTAYKHFGMAAIGIQVTRMTCRGDDLIEIKLKEIDTT